MISSTYYKNDYPWNIDIDTSLRISSKSYQNYLRSRVYIYSNRRYNKIAAYTQQQSSIEKRSGPKNVSK